MQPTSGSKQDSDLSNCLCQIPSARVDMTGLTCVGGSRNAGPEEAAIGNPGAKSNSSTSLTRSPAEQLLRAVAIKLRFDNVSQLNKICDNLSNEFIHEEWQLRALDSYQWERIGVPIGLSVAFSQLTHPTSRSSLPAHDNSKEEALPSVLRSSTAFQAPLNKNSAHKRSSDRFSVLNPQGSRAQYHANPLDSSKTSMEYTPEHAAEEALPPPLEDTNVTKEVVPPHCLGSFSRGYQSYLREPGNTPTLRSFPSTPLFQQALIHSKSGAELKAHTVFVMELSILAAALFLGASVEMWGAFPMDSVSEGPLWAPDAHGVMEEQPYVPQVLAIIYHFTSASSLIVQLFITSGWIRILHATAAVSPNKFHQFLVQTRYVFSNFMWFSELGVLLLLCNICILFAGMVAGTTRDPLICQLCFYVPTALILIASYLVHKFSSYIGRVAYHGFLLMDPKPECKLRNNNMCSLGRQAGKNDDSDAAAKAEDALHESFVRNQVLSEKKVLDIYHYTSQLHSDDDAEETYPSLFDLFFSNKMTEEDLKMA